MMPVQRYQNFDFRSMPRTWCVSAASSITLLISSSPTPFPQGFFDMVLLLLDNGAKINVVSVSRGIFMNVE